MVGGERVERHMPFHAAYDNNYRECDMAENQSITSSGTNYIEIVGNQVVKIPESLIEELRELFYDEDAVDADEDRIFAHRDGIEEDGSDELREWAAKNLDFGDSPHSSIEINL